MWTLLHLQPAAPLVFTWFPSSPTSLFLSLSYRPVFINTLFPFIIKKYTTPPSYPLACSISLPLLPSKILFSLSTSVSDLSNPLLLLLIFLIIFIPKPIASTKKYQSILYYIYKKKIKKQHERGICRVQE